MIKTEIIGGKIVAGRCSSTFMKYPGGLIDAILTENEKKDKVENWVVNPNVYTVCIPTNRPEELAKILWRIFDSVTV